MSVRPSDTNCLNVSMVQLVYSFVKNLLMQKPVSKGKKYVINKHAKYHSEENCQRIRNFINLVRIYYLPICNSEIDDDKQRYSNKIVEEYNLHSVGESFAPLFWIFLPRPQLLANLVLLEERPLQAINNSDYRVQSQVYKDSLQKSN